MNRLEMQHALYDSRNAYLKAKKEMEFQAREIQFLNQCIKELNLDLFKEMFEVDCPLAR